MYEFKLERKGDKVTVTVLESEDVDSLKPGTKFEFRRQEFEECEKRYSALKSLDPEADALMDFLYHGKCRA
jgi:DNA-binding transcriptional regulator/RsmH inhibitor MraZ